MDTADEIEALLAPIIGTELAHSAVIMQCKKMGIMPETLSKDKIDEFADRFGEPLRRFAGELAADDLITQIKAIRKNGT